MKLYQTYRPPFPTRVRLMLYAKGIDTEIVTPHGFHGDATPRGEYEEINPIGRVPSLVLDDGTVLPESEVICEYLEDAYPDPPLHPADPTTRARMRLLSRISDFYLVMAMAPLFSMAELPPSDWRRTKFARRSMKSPPRSATSKSSSVKKVMRLASPSRTPTALSFPCSC